MNRTERTEEMELAGWRDAWMQLGGKDRLAIELAARARKAALRHRAYQVVSVVVSIGVMVDLAWLVVHTRGSALAVSFCIAMSVVLGVMLTRLFADRIGSAGSTLDSFVTFTRERIARDLRRTRFKRRAVWIMPGLFVPWFVVACVSRWAIFPTSIFDVCLYVGGFLVTVLIALVHNRRRERKLLAEREDLETLVAERTLL